MIKRLFIGSMTLVLAVFNATADDRMLRAHQGFPAVYPARYSAHIAYLTVR